MQTRARLADRWTLDRLAPVGTFPPLTPARFAIRPNRVGVGPRSKFSGNSSLFFKVRSFLSPRGLRGSVLRPLLPTGIARVAFAIKLRLSAQGLLPDTGLQSSQDKTINFRCASSRFTNADERKRFRDGWLTHLSPPALYQVSVRNLAALTRMSLTTVLCQLTERHSQASFPRSITLPQLPSSSTLSIGVTVGILPSLRLSFSYRGLPPHKLIAMPGVPKR